MKTQCATILPAAEEYDDYPSQYITGSSAAAAFAYELNELDMRCIFAELRDQTDCGSRGDIDGEAYEVDYKVYRIEAVHHYRTHLEQGGDSYCGVWEMVPVVDEDCFDVRRVYDEQGRDYPELVGRLNNYSAKIQG